MYALKYFAGNIKHQGGEGGGEQGVGEEEEDEEGGNFKFSFVFFCKYFFSCKYFILFNFFFVNKYYELYIEVLVWLLSPSSSG